MIEEITHTLSELHTEVNALKSQEEDLMSFWTTALKFDVHPDQYQVTLKGALISMDEQTEKVRTKNKYLQILLNRK